MDPKGKSLLLTVNGHVGRTVAVSVRDSLKLSFVNVDVRGIERMHVLRIFGRLNGRQWRTVSSIRLVPGQLPMRTVADCTSAIQSLKPNPVNSVRSSGSLDG